jgi:hypothetical protein
MNSAFFSDFSSFGIIVACLLSPPVIGGFVQCLTRSLDAKKRGRSVPPFFQSISDFFSILRQNPATVSREQTVCALLSMTFYLTALGMLALQKHLPFILFLQAFGALAIIMGGMSRPVPYSGASVNHALKAFLTYQSVLFLVAMGFFFATGSFSLATVKQYPRLLVIDLPFLFMALLLVDYAAQCAVSEGGSVDTAMALAMLANCYRTATLVLFAGFFLSHSLLGAAEAAILLYAIVSISIFRAQEHGLLRRNLERGWGYLFFVCGLNLVWVYIKYWL